MKDVQIYTDGACSGNPGPGGWGAVLRYGEHVKEMSGYQPSTTNNRMEIFAAIEGLAALKQPCNVRLCSDSAYLVNAFEQGWLENWQRNGWMTSQKKPVENQDLWRILLMTIRRHGHTVKFVKVPGHADDVDNNRCDALAKAAVAAHQADLKAFEEAVQSAGEPAAQEEIDDGMDEILKEAGEDGAEEPA